jgi:hypothetical protein
VGKVGFEPTRVLLTDLQSAAFDRSAISPFVLWLNNNPLFIGFKESVELGLLVIWLGVASS